MQTITIRVTANKFAELARQLPGAVNAICETSARAIAVDAMASMGEPKTGRIYTTPEGKEHQASAPGESPAIDTGLLATIQTEADGPNAWATYTTAEYAAALEYGAPTQGILPRPFFTPAAERERPRFLRALGQLEDSLT